MSPLAAARRSCAGMAGLRARVRPSGKEADRARLLHLAGFALQTRLNHLLHDQVSARAAAAVAIAAIPVVAVLRGVLHNSVATVFGEDAARCTGSRILKVNLLALPDERVRAVRISSGWLRAGSR